MSTAPQEELKRLAGLVDAKIAEVSPRGRPPASQAVLLAAIALAHELEAERARCEALEQRTRVVLQQVLGRIDDALQPLEAGEADSSE